VFYVTRASLLQNSYRNVGLQSRQVIDIDIDIARLVTEYQTQTLEDEQENDLRQFFLML
jgi:hypothetical protein